MAVARSNSETFTTSSSVPLVLEKKVVLTEPSNDKLFPWVNNAEYSSYELDTVSLETEAENLDVVQQGLDSEKQEATHSETLSDTYKSRFQADGEALLKDRLQKQKWKIRTLGKKGRFGYTTAIKRNAMLRLQENGTLGVLMNVLRGKSNGESHSETRRKENLQSKESTLSPEVIREYIIGAAEMFDHIHFLCETVRASGELPLVLIPSRGSMPLLTAGRVAYEEVLRAKGQQSELSKVDSQFYPPGFFQYLSANYMRESNNPNPMSEVMIFPYTADITDERGKSDDREQANQIRYSAVRSTDAILKGEPNEDLAWSLTLTQSILSPLSVKNDYGQYQFSPEAYVQSLIELLKKQKIRGQRGEKTHLILVDTVLSGTASSQILRHCADLGIPVTPVLALDTSVNGARALRQRREKRQPLSQDILLKYTDVHRQKLDAIMDAVIAVQQKTGSQMINPDYSDIFSVFPLISEDRRPLLGINAVSVHLDPEVEAQFFPHRVPQSCVWTMSPETHPEFQTLLQMAYATAHNASDADLQKLSTKLDSLDAFDSRSSATPELIKKLVKREYWPSRFEVSNSGIIRLFLSADQSKKLVAQYQQNLK